MVKEMMSSLEEMSSETANSRSHRRLTDELRNSGRCSSRLNSRNRGRVCGWRRGCGGLGSWLTIRLGGGAVARDVSCLTTLVADFAGRVEWTTVGRSTITRDVSLKKSGHIIYSSCSYIPACHKRSIS